MAQRDEWLRVKMKIQGKLDAYRYKKNLSVNHLKKKKSFCLYINFLYVSVFVLGVINIFFSGEIDKIGISLMSCSEQNSIGQPRPRRGVKKILNCPI